MPTFKVITKAAFDALPVLNTTTVTGLTNGTTYRLIDVDGASPEFVPAVTAAPTITAEASVVVTDNGNTVTYVFTPPTVNGIPTPTVSPSLTLNGVDVTAQMSGNTYVATKTLAVQVLEMTYIAWNGIGSGAQSTLTRNVAAMIVPVAPSITAQASVVAVDNGSTVTYTFTPPTVNGIPNPNMTRVLTLNGIDVTSQMSGNVYVAATVFGATRNLTMTYTASNGVGSPATSVLSRTIPAGVDTSWSVTPILGGLTINSFPGIYSPAWSLTAIPMGVTINSYPGV